MDIYITEFMRMFEHYWFRAHLEGKTQGGKKKATVEQRLMGLKKIRAGPTSTTSRVAGR